MATPATNCERVNAGETASIENTHSSALSISLDSEDGSKIALDLAPKQVITFTAGKANVQLNLHNGDPAALRIIKPENAS